MDILSLKGLGLSFALLAIVFITPQVTKAALTVGSATITTDSTLGLQGGNVGIGNSAPTQELDVTGDAVFSGNLGIAGTAIDANKYINLTKIIAPSATTYGLFNSLTSSTNSSVVATGSYVTLMPGSGTTSSAVGVQPTVNNSGAGTLSFGMALDANSYSSGGGTVTTGIGLSGQAAAFTGGNIGTAKAAYLHAQNLGTGTITTGYGLQIEVDNTNAAGTIGTVYGLAMNSWSDIGTVNTSYGIYMDTSIDVGTTRYALYSSSTSNSYLAGSLGIGDPTPASALQVAGDITLSRLDGFSEIGVEAEANLAGGVLTIKAGAASLPEASGGDLRLSGGDGSSGVGGSVYVYGGPGVLEGNVILGYDAANTVAVGNVGIGITDPTEKLDVNSDAIRIRTAKTPATAATTCDQGEIAWDISYVYVCVATDTWKRSAIATW